MTAVSALIVGCGDVGSRLAIQLMAKGWNVSGLRRSIARLPAGVTPIAADITQPAVPEAWPAQSPDYLIYSVAASQHDEAGYQAAYVDGLRHVLQWLASRGQRPRRLVFVSSTSVYGQSGGVWVDETDATAPTAYTGRTLLQAEALAQASGIPATCVRLTGLYGPGRERMLNQVRQGCRVASEPPLYGNRIHVDDAAGLLAFLLQADADGKVLQPCYLGVDDEPAPLHEVVGWLRERLGVEADPEGAWLQRSASKRCSNTRARGLGWVPQYATYREGFEAMLGG